MKKVLLACLLGLLLAFSVTPVFADEDAGKVVFGGSYTLESGEEISGDLVILGGSADLERGSRVDGSMVVVGGSASVAGEIDGDVVVFGGNVVLRSTATVDGDLVKIGGSVRRESGAVVRGAEESVEIEGLPRIGTLPTRLNYDWWGNSWFSSAFNVFRDMFTAMALAAIGLLVVLFWPKQTEVVGHAVLTAPLPSAGVGLLTGVVAAVLMVLLAITICLSPVALLLVIALAIAAVFGWIAVGLLVGWKLLEAFNVRGITPLMAVAVGTLLISVLRVIPCLGSIFALVVGCAGLGAVVLTRFGRQAYPLSTRAPSAPPAPLVPIQPEELSLEEGELEIEEVRSWTEEDQPEATDVEPTAEEAEPGAEGS